MSSALGGNTYNHFLIHLSYKMRYFKFPKKYLLRPDGQTLELLLTSVQLSSFHISFRWDRPRTSHENSWCTLYHDIVAVRTEWGPSTNRS